MDAEAEAEDGWAREDVEGRWEGADILKDYCLAVGTWVGGKGFLHVGFRTLDSVLLWDAVRGHVRANTGQSAWA